MTREELKYLDKLTKGLKNSPKRMKTCEIFNMQALRSKFVEEYLDKAIQESEEDRL